MNNYFNNVFNGTTVLVTGHTGFKGSWLSTWLINLGAKVVGYSLEELPTDPSNFELCHLSEKIIDVRGDIRDLAKLQQTLELYKPKLVFHMAAQPIVLKAYDDPKTTFDTNAGGTVNILEAVRHCDSVEAVVCITSDKAYRNNEWVWGYRESDVLGDKDPYSASKAMAENAIEAYRASFFSGQRLGNRLVPIASTRAGNVIGGGDFASFRLVPDCMNALMIGEPIKIRNPANVRPWQLVLEPLSGYLWLAAMLLQDKTNKYAEAWNFGPRDSGITAGEISDTLVEMWGSGTWINTGTNEAKHEPRLLMLDCSKAREDLKWKPIYSVKETLAEVVDWYKNYSNQSKASSKKIDMFDICSRQIDKYTQKAKELGIKWADPQAN